MTEPQGGKVGHDRANGKPKGATIEPKGATIVESMQFARFVSGQGGPWSCYRGPLLRKAYNLQAICKVFTRPRWAMIEPKGATIEPKGATIPKNIQFACNL